MRSNFFVDTRGHCFLCLNKIGPGPTSSSIHSFHYASHYLGMDRRKAFNKNVPIPSHLLEKVKRSDLKVSLCKGCRSTTAKFSQQYIQLEKLTLAITSTLNQMHELMRRAEKNGRNEKFRKLAEGGAVDPEKVNIAQRVRKEAKKKCYLKLVQTPRVHIRRLSVEETSTANSDLDDFESTDISQFLSTELKEGLPNATNSAFSSQNTSFTSVAVTAGGGTFQIHHPVKIRRIMRMIEIEKSKNNKPKPKSNRFVGKKLQTSEKQFPCHFCKSLFSQLSYRNVHIAKEHPEWTKFKCALCNRKFPTKLGLKRHAATVHLKLYQAGRKCRNEKELNSSKVLQGKTRFFLPEKAGEIVDVSAMPETTVDELIGVPSNDC